MASLLGQGLVGTIDVRTARPLEYSERVIAVGARGAYNDSGKLNSGSNDLGYRLNASYIDQFADDTLGIALTASWIDEPYQIEEFNAWGYADVDNKKVIGGSKSYVTSTDLQRLGLTGTVQYQPTPELTFTLDGFYSDFEDDQIKRGIELPLAWGSGAFDLSTATATGNVWTNGTFTGVEGVVRNDSFERSAKLYSGGFNIDWQGDDGWNVFLDFGYSRTDRSENIIESYAGTGYGDGDGSVADGLEDTLGFTTSKTGTVFTHQLDYSDPNTILLTDSLGWGGDRVQAGYINNRIIDDELFQYRGEIEKELDSNIFSAFKFGLAYTDRTKSLTPDEAFLLLPNGATEAVIPSQYALNPTELRYLGLGPMLSYDPREMLKDGVYTSEANNNQDVASKAFSVSEDLMTMYFQTDILAMLGDVELTGNVGVQAIWTDQSSTGTVFLPDGSRDVQRFGDDYWDVLPSLNLSARIPGNWIVRGAFAREIQRPRIDDMRLSLGYGFNTNEMIIEGGGGNPFLRPYRAWAFDLNVEKYFDGGGYVSVQGFYKDITEYIDAKNGFFIFDFGALPLPDNFPAGNSTIGRLNVPVNTGGGDLYGVEVAGTLPFELFTPALEGFGITGGASWTDSNIEDAQGNINPILGYSKWVVNGTAYFEKGGFSLRGSMRYRSGFLGELSGFGASRNNRNALSETIFDAQIGYDFQDGTALEGLSLFFQAQNLSDERFATINDNDPLQVIDYQTYGRRFYVGFNYKF